MRLFKALRTPFCLSFTAFAVMAFMLGGCDYLPQDPEHTTRTVQETGVLKVAILENTPWVTDTDEPDGVDIRLVEAFAETLGAKPKWYRMGEEEAFRALEARQIHLVIGGLVRSTPRSAGLTRPYHITAYSVGRPSAAPVDLKDQTVAIKPASWLAKKIREKGAKPVETPEPFKTGYPVAAADWELAVHGYHVGVTLHKSKHVMAVQRGENRFIVLLEKFLESRQSEISRLLQEFTKL